MGRHMAPWCRAALLGMLLLAAAPSTADDKVKTNQLLIMTQGRSGSSFIGELVSKVPGALYLYEPCRSLTMVKTKDAKGDDHIQFGPVPEAACQAMAARVLGCQITEHDAERMFKDFVAISLCNYAAIAALSNKHVLVPRKVSEFNRMCARAPLRIVKEIRVDSPGQVLGAGTGRHRHGWK